MRGKIDKPEIKENKIICPRCGRLISLNPKKCECGVKIHVYRKKGRIYKITWCAPSAPSI